MSENNPFYCDTNGVEYTASTAFDCEATLYIKTGDRRKLNQLIMEYFGFFCKKPMLFGSQYQPVEILLQTQHPPTVIGTQTIQLPQGWCMVDINNFINLKDFGLLISERLHTTFIQTLAFYPTSYSYFLYCENGRLLREIENANFNSRSWIDRGTPLPFEKENNLHKRIFHCDTLTDYVIALGLDLHDTVLGRHYTQMTKYQLTGKI